MGEGWVLYSFPVHLAVCQGDPVYLRLLLSSGADPLKEYSDFMSMNKYKTSIAPLESARRKRHLHTIIILQAIPSLEPSARGVGENVFPLIQDMFLVLSKQENAETILKLIIELGGFGVMDKVSGDNESNFVRESKLKPLTMKSLCRRTIRKSYKYFLNDTQRNLMPFMKVMEKLPLPKLLLDYLLYVKEIASYEVLIKR